MWTFSEKEFSEKGRGAPVSWKADDPVERCYSRAPILACRLRARTCTEQYSTKAILSDA
jgi:hypothetical protein